MALSSQPRPKGRLFRKYIITIAILVGGALLISGIVDLFFSYRENRAIVAEFQRKKASFAAITIEQFIEGIKNSVRGVANNPRPTDSAGLSARRVDYLRLLNQIPSVTEVSYLDRAGKEQLRISRLNLDVVGGGADASGKASFQEAKAQGIYYSPVYFRDESEPYLSMAVAEPAPGSGVVVAEVNLKFIEDIVSGIKTGKAGHAYAVDSNGILVAHPNIDRVLRRTDLSSLPQVQAALAALAEPAAPRVAAVAIERDLRGNRVLTTYQRIDSLGWTVFLEQPLNEAFAPLYNSILRTTLLEVIGLGLAFLTSLVLARRMVAPILALQSGAARIGAGGLDQPIEVRTDDELEDLGEEFNRMNSRLRASYVSLNQKVEETERGAKDLQKANAQLVEAQDQLLRTEKLAVIGQLSAGVAHDLRNPLGAINNAAYYLKRRLGASEVAQSNPKIGQFLQVIEEEVQRSNQIITDLMGFVRISSPSLSPANLEQTIQDMLSSIEVRNNVRIVKRFQPELPEVLADAEQLRRVFINLTMNAQEAMPDGGELTISTRMVNGFAEVAFSDTGIGIPDENLKKVFDPLFTTKAKGTGLGLAVCQEIVTRHSGTIDVASKPGEGSTFTVRLPWQPLVEPGSDPRVVVAQESKPRI